MVRILHSQTHKHKRFLSLSPVKSVRWLWLDHCN